MYSFVNYSKDYAPTCFSVINIGQTGIEEYGNQVDCCQWLRNLYDNHDDELYDRAIPIGSVTTFTDNFSSAIGYDEVMRVDDGAGQVSSGVSGPLD